MSQRTRFTAAEVVAARIEISRLSVDEMLELGFIHIPAVLQFGKPIRYEVLLETIAEGMIIRTIKEIRGITGLGLAESKRLCDTIPSVVVTDLSKTEANEAAAQLREGGAFARVRVVAS